MANKTSLKNIGTKTGGTPINNFIITDKQLVVSNADAEGDLIVYLSDGHGVTEEDITSTEYRDLYIGDEHIAGGFGFKDITTREEFIETCKNNSSQLENISNQVNNIKNVLTNINVKPIEVDKKNNLIVVDNEEYELEIDQANKIKLKHSTRLHINNFKLYFKLKNEDINTKTIKLLLGDLNNDGILSESDTNILLNILAGNREKLSEVERIKADLTGNNLIEYDDLEKLNTFIELLKIDSNTELDYVNYNPFDKEYVIEYNGEDEIISFENDIIITKISFDCKGTSPLTGYKLSYTINNDKTQYYMKGDFESYENIVNNVVYNIIENDENQYYTGKYEIDINREITNSNGDNERKERALSFRFILYDTNYESCAIYTPKIKFQAPIYFGTIENESVNILMDSGNEILIKNYDEEININFKHDEINDSFGVIYIPYSLYYNASEPVFIYNSNIKITTKWNKIDTTNDSNTKINFYKYITPEKYKGEISWILKFK